MGALGGALYVTISTVIVSECKFVNNTAASYILETTDSEISNSEQERPTPCIIAISSLLAYGGAMYAENSTTTIDSCIFVQNSVYVDSKNQNNCTLHLKNYTESLVVAGGAIFAIRNKTAVKNSKFVENLANIGYIVTIQSLQNSSTTHFTDNDYSGNYIESFFTYSIAGSAGSAVAFSMETAGIEISDCSFISNS